LPPWRRGPFDRLGEIDALIRGLTELDEKERTSEGCHATKCLREEMP
jgi:hypothetical protein